MKEGLQACQATFPLMAVWPYALERIGRGENLNEIAAAMARQTQAVINIGTAALKQYSAVLTLSNSSLVRQSLIACKRRLVYCAESQPGGEGYLLAESLRQEGVKALIVEDERTPQIMAEADIILLGADQYDDSGFINKVGSRRLAELAGALDKPVLVLAEGFKRVARLPHLIPELARLEVKAGGEILRQTIFELVPWRPHVRLVSDEE
ncbi:hypothetical protein ACFL4K_02750 [Candidatus Neomarinimicrobiota bacterium]